MSSFAVVGSEPLAAEREFVDVHGERIYDRYHEMLNDFAAYVRQLVADQAWQPTEPHRVVASVS